MNDWIFIILLLCLYFAPTIIANSRGHKNAAGVFWVNLFLGLTGFGWIGALIWSVQIGRSEKTIESEVSIVHKKIK